MSYYPSRKMQFKKLKWNIELQTTYPEQNVYLYVEELKTTYHVDTEGKDIDGVKVINTMLNNSTHRWVGVAGVNNYYGGSAGGVETVSLLSDLSSISRPEGSLVQVLEVDSIFVYQADSKYGVNYYDVFDTATANSDKWVGITGERNSSDNSFEKIPFFTLPYEKEISHYPINVNRLKSIYKYYLDNFNNYKDFLHFDIQTEDNISYKALRFSSTIDLENFINTNVVSDNGGIINKSFRVDCYLKVRNDYTHYKRVVGFNYFQSALKTRWNSKNHRIVTLQNVADLGRQCTFINDFVNFTYSECLGVNNASLIGNIKSTIGFPCTIRKMYSLLPTDAKGKVFDYQGTNNQVGKVMFDSNLNITVDFNSIMTLTDYKLYLLDTKIFSIMNYDGDLVNLGEKQHDKSILTNSYSNIKVYILVDDLNNPRYYYFMLKPIGYDSFVIPELEVFNDENTPNIFVLGCNKIKKQKLYKLIYDPSNSQYGVDKFQVFRKREFIDPLLSSSERRLGTHKDNMNFRFYYGEPVSGHLYSVSEQFNMLFNTTGSPFTILPNRFK